MIGIIRVASKLQKLLKVIDIVEAFTVHHAKDVSVYRAEGHNTAMQLL